jgi:PIN domain nuclease of toxin-antitoxin system
MTTVAQQSIETETRMYMYDLLNTAKEFGFKAEDSWELSMVTNTERIKLQKDYFPTIASKIGPEILLQVYHTIKARLNQSFHKEPQTDGRVMVTEDLNYLVAINPKRPRT